MQLLIVIRLWDETLRLNFAHSRCIAADKDQGIDDKSGKKAEGILPRRRLRRLLLRDPLNVLQDASPVFRVDAHQSSKAAKLVNSLLDPVRTVKTVQYPAFFTARGILHRAYHTHEQMLPIIDMYCQWPPDPASVREG